MSTLFALKEKLATVGAELEKVSAELMDKAANAAVPIEEVQELKDKKANLDTRFNLIKEQHDKVEAEQRAQLQKSKITTAKTDEAKLVAAKAEFIGPGLKSARCPPRPRRFWRTRPRCESCPVAHLLTATSCSRLPRTKS